MPGASQDRGTRSRASGPPGPSESSVRPLRGGLRLRGESRRTSGRTRSPRRRRRGSSKNLPGGARDRPTTGGPWRRNSRRDKRREARVRKGPRQDRRRKRHSFAGHPAAVPLPTPPELVLDHRAVERAALVERGTRVARATGPARAGPAGRDLQHLFRELLPEGFLGEVKLLEAGLANFHRAFSWTLLSIESVPASCEKCQRNERISISWSTASPGGNGRRSDPPAERSGRTTKIVVDST